MRTLLCFLLAALALPALSQTTPPKYELRGAWIATVKHIDWPSRPGLRVEQQRSELIDMLDLMQAHGFNTVILQIRPAGDAFYPSAFEPWSEWLTGFQGQAPDPYYDPLAFAIEETHRRGMAFHAWFNPFRAVVDWDSVKILSGQHPFFRHPEWFVVYGSNLYFDPGLPQARAHVQRVISDVLHRYDIDAIHFDDYFYPYKIAGLRFPDQESFVRYGSAFSNIEDWRRDNINRFIRAVSDSILNINPDVQLGVSPFGVWRNIDRDPQGSATRAGQTCYDDLYADIRLWLQRGWIDYVAPQVYFSFGYPPASFEVIADWWRTNSFGKPVYIGHAPYKINNNRDPNWRDPSQILRQVRFTRRYPEIGGSIFFSSKWLRINPLGFADSLQQNLYQYRAFPPPPPSAEPAPMRAPYALETDSERDGIAVYWDNAGIREAAYVAVYRAEGKEAPPLEPAYLLDVVHRDTTFILDTDTRFFKKYTYRLSVLDRHYFEVESPEYRSQRRWSGLFRKKKKNPIP